MKENVPGINTNAYTKLISYPLVLLMLFLVPALNRFSSSPILLYTSIALTRLEGFIVALIFGANQFRIIRGYWRIKEEGEVVETDIDDITAGFRGDVGRWGSNFNSVVEDLKTASGFD